MYFTMYLTVTKTCNGSISVSEKMIEGPSNKAYVCSVLKHKHCLCNCTHTYKKAYKAYK